MPNIRKTLMWLELLMQSNCGKIIGASLDGDIERRLSKKLYSMKKRGLIQKKDGLWKITSTGRKYYIQHRAFKHFDNPFSEKSNPNYIIIFDIPESQRPKRDYLRNQLKVFTYKQIQRSVWQGPGPLPSAFLSYLDELRIKDMILIFKINKNLKPK